MDSFVFIRFYSEAQSCADSAPSFQLVRTVSGVINQPAMGLDAVPLDKQHQRRCMSGGAPSFGCAVASPCVAKELCRA